MDSYYCILGSKYMILLLILSHEYLASQICLAEKVESAISKSIYNRNHLKILFILFPLIEKKQPNKVSKISN